MLFALGEALVTVEEVHAAMPSGARAGFSLDVGKARMELEKGDGVIRPVSRFSDPDELHGLVIDALEGSIIKSKRSDAYLRIVPSAVTRPGPFLVVEPGAGAPSLAAGDLHPSDIDDPIEFTMSFLRLVVEHADRASTEARYEISPHAP